MPIALPGWVISFLVNTVFVYVARAIKKWGESIDWALVKADVAERVRALVPGDWFDDTLVEFADAVVDKVASLLSAPDKFGEIVALILKGDVAAAIEKLKELVAAALTAEQADLDPVGGATDEQVIAESFKKHRASSASVGLAGGKAGV